jgi:PAS domain-containing protein
MANQLLSQESLHGSFRIVDLDPDAAVLGADEETELLLSLGGGESRGSDYTGTKALMLAILEDGVRAYLGSTPRLRAEAELWVCDPQSRWIFSFGIICETLGLEPDSVRAVLDRWRTTEASPDMLREARRDRMRAAARRRRITRPLES